MAQLHDIDEWTPLVDADMLKLLASNGTQRRALKLPCLRSLSRAHVSAYDRLERCGTHEASLDALSVYSRGQIAKTPCSWCQKRRIRSFPFPECVFLRGFWGSACATCIMRGRGGECSLALANTPSPLERLPVEILEMILRLLIPSGERIRVRYHEGEPIRMDELGLDREARRLRQLLDLHQSVQEAQRLMRVNRRIGAITSQLFYRYNTFTFPSWFHQGDDLARFARELRDETLGHIRLIAVTSPSLGNMEPGINYMFGCFQLSNLGFDDSELQDYLEYKPVLSALQRGRSEIKKFANWDAW